jgi:hypothetical protein
MELTELIASPLRLGSFISFPIKKRSCQALAKRADPIAIIGLPSGRSPLECGKVKMVRLHPAVAGVRRDIPESFRDWRRGELNPCPRRLTAILLVPFFVS